MCNFDEATITDTVLHRVRAAKNDRGEMTQPYCHLNYDFGLKADSETRRSEERAA
jgi:hypothetical protein